MCGLGIILTIIGLVLSLITYQQGHPAVSVVSGFITAFVWCIIALSYRQKYDKAKTVILAIQEEARINDILFETHVDDVLT